MESKHPDGGIRREGADTDFLHKKMSRREVLRLSAAAGFGLVLGMGSLSLLRPGEVPEGGAAAGAGAGGIGGGDVIEFYGPHQAGIATPQQDHLVLASFDVTGSGRNDLRDLLRLWSSYAARMCRGERVGADPANRYLPPDDNGEAVGLAPGKLTITFGLGPTLFRKDGVDRFGLAGQQPEPLREIPPMPRDDLRPEWCGGDLCIQACSDDPQVAFHAIRHLARAAAGAAAVRWVQQGFLRKPSNAAGEAGTPRNLFGFKDGTGNVDIADPGEMNRHIWVNGTDQPSWMRGGTYLAVRRIRMLIEVWDRSSLTDQEKTMGRKKDSGAPFGGQDEFSPVNPALLPATSHVRLARGDGSVKMLRRSYSYLHGIDGKTGSLDAGLVFMAFQRDLQKQFVPVLERLAAQDALNEYISHIGSAVFACPPGARPGGYVGETLLG
ncbi:iron uptake transporter deferrochelatase/peroxidase subunit [Kyrpidia tusciae]|uniref:Deferrochelatase n=1 Tax=Kyrpidia tusciae (strain DSM 2912 / NBRC 15312 / T2) TaxID=562970 RepID=D5WU27_KYRT2|nr:iron uptake transporter deferrochelatase/peroxidase subunit [Kyrpidia tusciae]ADG07279.1 Dyp-type peroxidase family [Kyrpidia tusciae DSM 2912]